jgi:hypothetical protein
MKQQAQAQVYQVSLHETKKACVRASKQGMLSLLPQHSDSIADCDDI